MSKTININCSGTGRQSSQEVGTPQRVGAPQREILDPPLAMLKEIKSYKIRITAFNSLEVLKLRNIICDNFDHALNTA